MQKFLSKYNIYLIAILTLGAIFRFYGINWDQGFHLHPDERFLTMVGNAMKLPNTFFEYFDPKISPFNPANIGYTFFVYGTLPLVLNKLVALILQNDTYNEFTLQGRFLSGLVDLIIIIFLFKTVELLEKHHSLHRNIKYFASFFYAIAVLPIQLSHFFAVDTFLNLFMFASFYFILKFSYERRVSPLMLSSALLGCAFASKITAFFILPLHLIFIKKGASNLINFVKYLSLFFAILYLSLQIADPYLFENKNFLDPTINNMFVENIRTLKSWEGKEVWYPPSVQWISKPPILFSLINLAIFGLGIPSFIFSIFGIFSFARRFLKTALIVLPLWVLLFFLFQSLQFAQAMRYFIFLYPFIAIFAAIGFNYVTGYVTRYVTFILIGSILLWPLAFVSIYVNKHSRVVASEWIYQNLEDQSIILGEHWDDPLPLSVTNTYQKTFTVKLLPVFDQDTPEKWKTMHELLDQGNYLILSSNRGWGSIPTVPDKYPLMSKFYKDLFDGKLPYKKIKEFTSYPKFSTLNSQFSIPDDWADESFTVYDHPRVIIFKKILF